MITKIKIKKYIKVMFPFICCFWVTKNRPVWISIDSHAIGVVVSSMDQVLLPPYHHLRPSYAQALQMHSLIWTRAYPKAKVYEMRIEPQSLVHHPENLTGRVKDDTCCPAVKPDLASCWYTNHECRPVWQDSGAWSQ